MTSCQSAYYVILALQMKLFQLRIRHLLGEYDYHLVNNANELNSDGNLPNNLQILSLSRQSANVLKFAKFLSVLC